MKQRTAFVANSSSSSFLIVGNRLDIANEGIEFESEYSYEQVNEYEQMTGLDAIPISEDSTECYIGKIVFDEEGRGSMSVEELKQKIGVAEEFLKSRGVTDYKAYFGESYR